MLKNAYLDAKIGFDTEENEPSKVGGSSLEWEGSSCCMQGSADQLTLAAYALSSDDVRPCVLVQFSYFYPAP